MLLPAENYEIIRAQSEHQELYPMELSGQTRQFEGFIQLDNTPEQQCG